MDIALKGACILTGLHKTKRNILEVEKTTLSKERKEKKITLLQISQLRRGLRLLIKVIEVLIPIMQFLAIGTGTLSIMLLGGESEVFYYLVLSKIFAIIGGGITTLIVFLRGQLKESRREYISQYRDVLEWFTKNAPELI